MEATVAERGQITLPKAVRDALGLTKGTKLKVELIDGRIVLRKDVDDARAERLRPGITEEGAKAAEEKIKSAEGVLAGVIAKTSDYITVNKVDTSTPDSDGAIGFLGRTLSRRD